MSIIAKNISYIINKNIILDNITIEIKNGEILTILGPNGAGKSTLINLLAGDNKITLGCIKYDKINIEEIKIKKRASIRSIMSSSSNIIFDYLVRDIIEMGWIDSAKKEASLFSKSLYKISKECNIYSLLYRKFNSLSSGEKRRVHLARTLLQLYNNKSKKKYLMLDEPTENLDLFYEKKIMHLIRKKADNGYAVVMVLHNINLAYQFSDKILLLKNGKKIHYGCTEEVLTETNLKKVYNIPISIKNKNILINYT